MSWNFSVFEAERRLGKAWLRLLKRCALRSLEICEFLANYKGMYVRGRRWLKMREFWIPSPRQNTLYHVKIRSATDKIMVRRQNKNLKTKLRNTNKMNVTAVPRFCKI
jgi:hypothetical protein